MSAEKFLGRTLNPQTMMYEFPDGSGHSIPAEVAEEARAAADGQPGSFIKVFALTRKPTAERATQGETS